MPKGRACSILALSLITAWNTKNRVPLGAVKPGDRFQIAIFGVNGPIPAAPTNRIFF